MIYLARFPGTALGILCIVSMLLHGCDKPSAPSSSVAPGDDRQAPPSNSPHLSPIPQAGSEEERIRAVLLQLASKRQGIESYSMDIEQEKRSFPETPLDEPLPRGTVDYYDEGTRMTKGDWWRIHRSKRWIRPERPESTGAIVPVDVDYNPDPYEHWEVYNPEYYASWQTGTAIQLITEKAIGEGAIMIEAMPGINPLHWGFGVGSPEYLDQVFEKSRAEGNDRWSLEEFETDDGPKVKIVQHRGTSTRHELTLDPLRDFLVVESRWFRKGEQSSQRKITLQQLGDGRWFAHRIIKRDKTRVWEFTFDNVVFNPTIDDSMFTIDSFDIDYANTVLSRRDSYISTTKMVHWEGQWRHASAVPRHLHPKQMVKVYRHRAEKEPTVTTEQK